MAALPRWGYSCPKCKHRFYYHQETVAPFPPCPKCDPEAYKQHFLARSFGLLSAEPPAVAKVIKQCDTILSMVDEMPPEGMHYGDSVRGKVEGIRETISNRRCVTAAQLSALNNMEDGVGRWLHHD